MIDMEETRIPGEFEAVVVRMPMKINQNLLVNFYIAKKIKKAIYALNKLQITNDLTKRKKLNDRIAGAIKIIDKYEPVSIADRVMSLLSTKRTSKVLTADFARYLVTPDKSVQCKKLGIAFLGTFGVGRDLKVVREYASDEEYTFFCVKALRQLEGDQPEFIEDLAKVASETQGWGKIAAILEMPDRISNEGVRSFLLMNGTANTIGRYHLAVECAIKGRLKEYLEYCVSRDIFLGREISEGICTIFLGLFEGEKIKDADSFTEVPGIESIIENYKKLYENSHIDCPQAKEIYQKLKDRK